jgi:hypothetical protein
VKFLGTIRCCWRTERYIPVRNAYYTLLGPTRLFLVDTDRLDTGKRVVQQADSAPRGPPESTHAIPQAIVADPPGRSRAVPREATAGRLASTEKDQNLGSPGSPPPWRPSDPPPWLPSDPPPWRIRGKQVVLIRGAAGLLSMPSMVNQVKVRELGPGPRTHEPQTSVRSWARLPLALPPLPEGNGEGEVKVVEEEEGGEGEGQ